MTKREIKKLKDPFLEQCVQAINDSVIYDYEEMNKFHSITLNGFNIILSDKNPNNPIIYINEYNDKTSKDFNNWKLYYKFFCKDIKSNNIKNYLYIKFNYKDKVFQSFIRIFDPEDIKYWKDYNEIKLDNGKKTKPPVVDIDEIIDGNFGDKPFTLIKTICLSDNEPYINNRRSLDDNEDFTYITVTEQEVENEDTSPVYTKPLF